MNLFGSENHYCKVRPALISMINAFVCIPIFAVAIQGSLKDKKVLLLGVSYLNDVGDTRYTPVEVFYDQFAIAGN